MQLVVQGKNCAVNRGASWVIQPERQGMPTIGCDPYQRISPCDPSTTGLSPMGEKTPCKDHPAAARGASGAPFGKPFGGRTHCSEDAPKGRGAAGPLRPAVADRAHAVSCRDQTWFAAFPHAAMGCLCASSRSGAVERSGCRRAGRNRGDRKPFIGQGFCAGQKVPHGACRIVVQPAAGFGAG